MSGGYETPPTGEYAELIRQLRDVSRRLDELERPGGTQIVLEDESEREDASGFVVGTGFATVVTIPYTCPPYKCRTNFLLGGQVFARNTRGVTDFLYVQVEVEGSVFGLGQGNPQPAQAAASAWGSATTGYAADVTTQAGETITFRLLVRADGGPWSADGSNQASLWVVASHKIRS